MLVDIDGLAAVELVPMAPRWILPCHACQHGRVEPQADEGVCCAIDAALRCKPFLPLPQGKRFYVPDKRNKKYRRIEEQDRMFQDG